MRRYVFIIMLILMLILLVGCRREAPQQPADPAPKDPQEPVEPGVDSSYTLRGFVPGREMIKIFSGGFEDAGSIHVIDKIEDDKFQVKQIDTAAAAALVYSVDDNEIVLVFSEETSHFEENYFNKINNRNHTQLKTPLEKGTTWTDGEGGTYTITGVDVEFETEVETYKAIEVTLRRGDFELKRYYARDIGLVGSVTEDFGSMKLLGIDYDIQKVQDQWELNWLFEEYFPWEPEFTNRQQAP